MKFLIIGPQGSGKGTQADLLAKRLGIPHISSGDLLRAEKQSGSVLGKEIAAMIDKGELVPDTMIWEMIKARLSEHPEGWLLDGYPRQLSQAETLDAYQAPDTVLVLDVPDEVCVERISGRRVCETCGRDYHIKYKPPKEPGKCDVDGSRLVQRTDDYPEAVRKRLADYHAKTAPLIEHYGDKIVRVNGDQGIQDVWQEIQKKLGI